MIYLDIDRTIVYDEENNKILFYDGRDNSKYDIPSGAVWDLFKELVKNEGNECDCAYLVEKMHVEYDSDNPGNTVKTYIQTLKNNLKSLKIPLNTNKTREQDKLSICNKPKKYHSKEQLGSYTLYLPKIENEYEQIIATLFWNRYELISAKKEGVGKDDEFVAKIGDVYQIPELLENNKTHHWSTQDANLYERNMLIEAPNGFGKTTFLRSILLASIYEFINDLSKREKNNYKKLRDYHCLDKAVFCIYMECKDINLNNESSPEGCGWIYDYLSGNTSIQIDRYIKVGDFENLIKQYNQNNKFILLIDGLDEIEYEKRAKLIDKLACFQRNQEYGNNAEIIMTTRPLFWKNNFNGYRKITLSNRNILEDRNVFVKYVQSYTQFYDSFDSEKLYNIVFNNFYLTNLICTPALIVWIIREYKFKNELYISIERIIEQIMRRYKSREVTAHMNAYKMIYEEIAYEYLCFASDEGLSYMDTEMISFVRGCIEIVKRDGNSEFNRVFNDEKNDEEIGELFFTNVALLENTHERIKFSSLTFAYHYAARRILRLFKNYGFTNCGYNNVEEKLDRLPVIHRYHVMVIAASLAIHLDNISFFNGFGESPMSIQLYVEETFIKYLKNKWNSNISERNNIEQASFNLVNNLYGMNVYTKNGNMPESNKWLKSIIEL